MVLPAEARKHFPIARDLDHRQILLIQSTYRRMRASSSTCASRFRNVAKEAAAFDDLGDLWRDHFFPGFITRFDALQNIAREDVQQARVVVLQLADATSFHQM